MQVRFLLGTHITRSLLAMSKSEIVKFLILRSIGNFLLLFAIFGVIATFGPALFYEVQFRIIQARGVEFKVQEPTTSPLGEILARQRQFGSPLGSGFAKVLTGPKEQILIPKDTDFSILIPKIGASSKVFPNVDPSSEKAFLPVLQNGIAHAEGTVFPGMPGNIYLFAHSADNFWDVGRYNAVFYLLKDLMVGDEVVVFFENRRHNYRVFESRIVDPSEVSFLTKSQESGTEVLILQTCWPPGTTWKRLMVFAKPK